MTVFLTVLVFAAFILAGMNIVAASLNRSLAASYEARAIGWLIVAALLWLVAK